MVFELRGGVSIAPLPKLRIKNFGYPGQDICELVEAGYLWHFENRMILVDGQRLQSYADLVQLAAQDKYQNKDFIEVALVPTIAGG